MSTQSTVQIPTTCWECSICCGALATVQDGCVTKLDPNPAHPGSGGMFCVKGFRGTTGIVGSPQRLTHARRREHLPTAD